MILSVILGVLSLLSLALGIWQLAVALRFPLHLRLDQPRFTPGITLLKPLKGCDARTRECLASWLAQDYAAGPRQILFGVASADDPVCGLVRQLIAEHPGCDAQLVICPEQLGANAKVSQLVQLHRRTSQEVVCISDADVWVPPDFLLNAVAPLAQDSVGLVHSFYQMQNGTGLGMRWEAFAVNVDFWSQVLQSASLKPVAFALGAAMITTRRRLDAIGGFSALVDYLADDYQLGHRVAGTGGEIAFCPVVVECRSDTQSFAEVWAHLLRWARTIRACQPGPFFASILSNASIWPLLWFSFRPSVVSAAGAVVCLLFRWVSARRLERRLTGRTTASGLAMPLVKDLLGAVTWACAFLGSGVRWRGVSYGVLPGGKLVRGRVRV
ncbi:MAG TPA: glycosyltransferase [Candidatus Saccharimonadales bacterium]|nr:glycosyltransferase [Candidatus Saccharimonadales bacterium]